MEILQRTLFTTNEKYKQCKVKYMRMCDNYLLTGSKVPYYFTEIFHQHILFFEQSKKNNNLRFHEVTSVTIFQLTFILFSFCHNLYSENVMARWYFNDYHKK